MKLIYHIIIITILYFTIPTLFILAALYWIVKIGFTILCIVVKPLVELGIINPTSNLDNQPNSTYRESYTDQKNREHQQFIRDEKNRRQVEIDRAIAESYSIFKD